VHLASTALFFLYATSDNLSLSTHFGVIPVVFLTHSSTAFAKDGFSFWPSNSDKSYS
jgi:hypothetical protein